MAARRDRERRRPSGESRYRFAAPEAAVEPDDGLAAVDGSEPSRAVETPSSRRTSPRRGAVAADLGADAAKLRSGARPTPLPFSSYAADYAYVISDLRRVGLVIGSLLLVLILLYVILPH